MYKLNVNDIIVLILILIKKNFFKSDMTKSENFSIIIIMINNFLFYNFYLKIIMDDTIF